MGDNMSNFGDASFGVQSAISVNSTITPLSGSATFTGSAEQNNYPDVMCSCYSDTEGTLYFDFSVNGTDWRTFPSSGFAVAAGIHEFHTAIKGPRYFRVRFVNGSAGQTTFQLYAYYGVFRLPSAPLNQTIRLDADSNVTRPTIAQDEISRGLRNGVTQFNKFAHRPDLDTADGDAFIIANSTTNAPTLLTTAETYTITYNSANDGAGGGATGAVNLYFYHLDSNGESTISVHTLGSTGSDVTSFSGLGVNRCVVGSSGSSQTNVSDITITHTTTATVAAFIPAGSGVTQQAILFVPDNAKGLAKSLLININKLSGGSAPVVIIRGWVWNRTIETKFEVFRYIMDTSVENHITFTDACNFPLNASDVLWFTAETDTNNTVIGALRFSSNIYENA